MLLTAVIILFFIISVTIAFSTNKNSAQITRNNSFNWKAFFRALIIAIGAGIPLLLIYLLVALALPGNINLFGADTQEPSIVVKSLNILVGLILIYIDYQIGRRYYNSIIKSNNTKP